MPTLLIALLSGVAFIVAYHTYGRWLGCRIFQLATPASLRHGAPSHRLRDDSDYVPTKKSVVFGHHFTSIAGTGPIVGPAIAVMWGWLPALLWVVLGSIFIGAVHDLGSLVVSLRNNGQTVGDIAGRVLSPRVRVLFLLVLFLALAIVLAIFGLVIANVFRLYPSAIFPVWVQLPIAVAIGLWLHRKGASLLWPSLLALALMYLTVVFGDQNTRVGVAFLDDTLGGALHAFNTWAASLPIIVWVGILLVYSYVASVIPVWCLLQPRDYINSLQLISALGLIVLGLVAAAFWGGAPPVPGAERIPLQLSAPMVNWNPAGAPLLVPFLFITVACGAISGFHCLVSSGTSSKQLDSENDAQFVGYGAMLTEGFLAVIVILACVAGLGLGVSLVGARNLTSFRIGPAPDRPNEFLAWYEVQNRDGQQLTVVADETMRYAILDGWGSANDGDAARDMAALARGDQFPTSGGKTEVAPGVWVEPYNHPNKPFSIEFEAVGAIAFAGRYTSWSAAGGLGRTVAAFVDGGGNFLKALGVPAGVATALLGVLVASFAGTTLDTACRLQRYVIQELAATFAPKVDPFPGAACPACGYDLSFNTSGACPECGSPASPPLPSGERAGVRGERSPIVGDTVAPPVSSEAQTGSPLTPTLSPRGRGGRSLDPRHWLTNKHAATLFAILTAGALAALPAPGQPWSLATAGGGGMILWPMFGATNQLLGGLAFLVIAFYLLRRRKPVWFLTLPLLFMLVMPAWALAYQMFIASPGSSGGETSWLEDRNYLLLAIAALTLALEAWMIVEAFLLWPRVKGLLEPQLPGAGDPLAVLPEATAQA